MEPSELKLMIRNEIECYHKEILNEKNRKKVAEQKAKQKFELRITATASIIGTLLGSLFFGFGGTLPFLSYIAQFLPFFFISTFLTIAMVSAPNIRSDTKSYLTIITTIMLGFSLFLPYIINL